MKCPYCAEDIQEVRRKIKAKKGPRRPSAPDAVLSRELILLPILPLLTYPALFDFVLLLL